MICRIVSSFWTFCGLCLVRPRLGLQPGTLVERVIQQPFSASPILPASELDLHEVGNRRSDQQLPTSFSELPHLYIGTTPVRSKHGEVMKRHRRPQTALMFIGEHNTDSVPQTRPPPIGRRGCDFTTFKYPYSHSFPFTLQHRSDSSCI